MSFVACVPGGHGGKKTGTGHKSTKHKSTKHTKSSKHGSRH